MEKGVENLILNAGNLKKDEKLLILFESFKHIILYF